MSCTQIEVKTVAYIRCWGDVPIATKLLQLMSKAIRWALGLNEGIAKVKPVIRRFCKSNGYSAPTDGAKLSF